MVAPRRRIYATAVASLLAFTTAACAAGTVTPEEFQSITGQTVPEDPAPAPGPEAAAAGADRAPERRSESRTELGPIGFGSGETVVQAVIAETGTAELLFREVVLYPGYGIAEAARAATPGDVDRFTVRSSGVDDSTPVRIPAQFDLAAATFAPAEVPWAAVPAMVETATATLGIPGAEATHVIVERNVPFSNDVVLRVYVGSERASGRVEFATDGRQLRTYRD